MQETLGSEILIEVRPVYSIPGSSNAPVRTFLRRRMQQPGVPRQRNRYGSSVEKINTDGVVSDSHVINTFAGFRFRSTHSMPPIVLFGAPL